MKKQHILIPELKGELYWVRIPHGVSDISVCYVTESQQLPQRIKYENRLEVGHDFQIRNGFIISRRKEVLENNFILIETSDSMSKKCKTCRKESDHGPFCSHCGAYLF